MLHFLSAIMTQLGLVLSLIVIYCLQIVSNVHGEEVEAKREVALAPAVVPGSASVSAGNLPNKLADITKIHESKNNIVGSTDPQPLEPRLAGDRSFIKDIVDRLHALDADIGKLLYNSTSMYAPNDQSIAFQENSPKGGERFTEVLSDLDALQDEVSSKSHLETYLLQDRQ